MFATSPVNGLRGDSAPASRGPAGVYRVVYLKTLVWDFVSGRPSSQSRARVLARADKCERVLQTADKRQVECTETQIRRVGTVREQRRTRVMPAGGRVFPRPLSVLTG